MAVFQRKREADIAHFVRPGSKRFNQIGRRSWWHGHNVDQTLVEHSYCP
jgi:hypothetical protein